MRNLIFRIYILIVCLLLASGYSAAQLITIETIIDTNTVVLGRTAKLTYAVKKHTDDVIQLPVFNDTIFDGIELVGNVSIDSTKINDEKELLNQTLTITSYETGMRYIPAQPFIFEGPYGKDTIMSNPGYLNVVGIDIDSSNTIRDIGNVEWVMPTLADMLPIILGLLGLGLIVFLIIYFWPGKRQKEKEEIRLKPSDPPHIIALRELDKLKAQKLWQNRKIKEYYTRLTEIIRTYIENLFGVLAMEESTSEILQDIKKIGIDSKINMSQLEELLNLADLVKFAKGDAQPEENVEQLEVAYNFVKTSRKVYVEEATQSYTGKRDEKLSKSYSLSKRIRNVRYISDLEVYNRIENGSRLVQYKWIISLIFITYSNNSGFYLINQNEKGIKQGIIYSIITILFGWWGIPSGPVRSIDALKSNFSGGNKVQI